MVESSATLRMRAVDTGLVETLNRASVETTNLQIAAVATTASLQGLNSVARTNVAQMTLGAQSATNLATGLNRASGSVGKFASAAGQISLIAFYLQQVGTAVDGVARASEKAVNLPTTLQAMQSSGVSTAVINDFGNLAGAVKGSDIAIQSLVTNAIAKLGQFEGAATRAGTILKSSVNFDEQGQPLRASATERLENALSIQRLVNNELKNSVTSTEALAGQYEVLSSGFVKTAESQEVLTSGLKLVGIAEAGGVAANTSQTLQLLTKTLNAYELSSADAAKTAGILNGIVENGLTTIQQLSLGFGSTSKQANQANIALEDLGASVAVLTSQGVTTPLALTGINRVAANIIDKTPEAEKALAKLQLRGERIRFDKAEIQAKGFTQALVDLNEAAGGSPEILSKIFPEDVAFRTVNALLAERGKRLSTTLSEIAKSDAQSLQEVYEISTSDRTKRFQRLSNRIQESIVRVGLSLAPTLEPGIRTLEKLADTFARLPEPIKNLIGGYIALQIRTKAYGAAAGILAKTLGSLAANYLVIRTISLAVAGQLGREINVIKQLIVQRKGLLAATLQLFGINQKWRLSEVAATETVQKQSRVLQFLAASRAKATAAAKAATIGAVAKVSGTSTEQVSANVQNLIVQGKLVAAQAAAGAKEIGKAVVGKTQEAVTAAQGALGIQPPLVVTTAAIPRPLPALPPARSPLPSPAPIVSAAPVAPAPSRLDRLIASDKAYTTTLNQQIALEDDLIDIRKKRGKISDQITKLSSDKAKAETKLLKAKQEVIQKNTSATATNAERQKAAANVQKQQAKLSQINNRLDEQQLAYTQANTQALVAKNRVNAATIKTEEAKAIATAKYRPLAIAITEAEKAQTAAIAANQAAIAARYQAEEIALIQGAKSQAATAANAKAKLLEAQATKAQELAILKKNIAVRRETAITLKQNLAAKGLFQTKLFGNKVTVSQTGIIGALNKALATNITLTVIQTKAIKALNVTRLLSSKLLDINTYKLLKENILLASKNVKGFASGIKGLIAGGAGGAGSVVKGLLGSFGLLTPLLTAAGLAAFILRDRLFGIGKVSRELRKEYQQLLKEQELLNKKLGIATTTTKIETSIKAGDLKQANVELIELKNSGAITAQEFERLNKKFPTLVNNTKESQLQIKEFRKELNRLNLDTAKIEKGVVEKTFGIFKAIPKGIGFVIDGLTNELGAAIVNVLDVSSLIDFKNFDAATAATVKLNREADNLIDDLSRLNALQKDIGFQYLETTKAIVNYRTNLALTDRVAERVAKGFRLTEAELKLEDKAFKQREQSNAKQITIADQLIKKNEELLAKVKSPELQDLYSGQIVQAQQQKENLEAQNEELRKLRSQIRKYLTEELPAIQTALQERSNPQLLFDNAKEAYQNVFLDDNGLILKPLEQLRNEAFKLANAVTDSLSLGLFDQEFDTGELRAAQELRAIRDEQISFYQDGELKQGYRLALNDRKALTEQIVTLENIDLKRAQANQQLELKRLNFLKGAKIETEATAALEISKIQEQEIANNIALQTARIAELKKLNLRTVEEENQLAQLRQEAEFARFATASALLNQRLAELELRNNRITLAINKTIADSQLAIAGLSQESKINNLLLTIYNQQLATQEKNASLQQEITSNSVFTAQTQAQLAKSRLENLAKTLPIIQQQLAIESKITAEQSKQQLLNAQIQERSAQLQLTRLEEQKALALQNNASQGAIDQLDLEISGAKLQLEQAQSKIDQARFQLDIESQILSQKQEQLAISQNEQAIAAEIALSNAQRAASEAEIGRTAQLRSQFVETEVNFLNLEKSAIAQRLNSKIAELNYAKELTNSERKKQEIAQKIAALKLKSLEQQINLDARILASSQQQEQIQQRRERSLNQSRLSENLADIFKAQAKVEELQASGADSRLVQAAQAQIQATLAERQSLQIESQRINQRGQLLEEQQIQARRRFQSESAQQLTAAQIEGISLLEGEKGDRRRKRLLKQLLGTDNLTDNLGSILDRSFNFNVEVPTLSLPQIKLPSLEDIAQDVKSLLTNSQPTSESQPTIKKQIIVQSLQLESPINVSVTGDDPEAIADRVEERIFNNLVTQVQNTDFEIEE